MPWFYRSGIWPAFYYIHAAFYDQCNLNLTNVRTRDSSNLKGTSCAIIWQNENTWMKVHTLKTYTNQYINLSWLCMNSHSLDVDSRVNTVWKLTQVLLVCACNTAKFLVWSYFKLLRTQQLQHITTITCYSRSKTLKSFQCIQICNAQKTYWFACEVVLIEQHWCNWKQEWLNKQRVCGNNLVLINLTKYLWS